MNVIYQGVDITNSIDIIRADITDNASGSADSLDLTISDISKLWVSWQPKKGDTIQVKHQSIDSGIMFVDQLEQSSGKFSIKAISIPLNAKTLSTRYWENVSFLELVGDVAGKYGFAVKAYGIANWLYEKVEQIEQTDFEFLAYRCMLEGYCLKIINRQLVIYDERYLEQQTSGGNIYLDDLATDYEMKAISVGLYNSSEILCNKASGELRAVCQPASAPAGPALKKNIYLSDQAEADRFVEGLLRHANKHEYTGRLQLQQITNLAAGSNINLVDVGLLDGKAFIYQAVNKLVESKTVLRVRKPLEGY